MLRLTLTAFALIPLACSQSLPAFRWIEEVDASGFDSFAGLGVDALGNTYIAGSTYSSTFPVKAAAQNHLASDGLYRIDGPGSAFVALGLSTASSIVLDPLNANTLNAISAGSLLRSTDGGATFSPLLSAIAGSDVVTSFVVDPMNDQILYASTSVFALLKSTDGGVTWQGGTASLGDGSSNESSTQLWIDPSMPNVLFANTSDSLWRSADGGMSWQIVYSSADVAGVSFDPANPGTLYATTYNDNVNYKSTDHGLTFTIFATPVPFGTILADPNQSGRLLGSSEGGIYESDDGGSTWTLKLNLGFVSSPAFAADWVNGFLYAPTASSSVVRITTNLQTVTPVGPPAVGNINGIAVANGHAYVAVSGTRDVYVTKLDPSGNVVYSTYFGGSADDVANAMTVDPAGNVYVTGTTTSLDFPVTKGAYASTGASFLFRLNPDGSVGYSTYFAPSGTSPGLIAVDSAGSAYLAGSSQGGLPVTPGAYQTTCNCGIVSNGFFGAIVVSGFVTKFDPTASILIYSTYIQPTELESPLNALALALDGSVYLGGINGIAHLNAAGSAVLASLPPTINVQAMAVGPDGSLYAGGSTTSGFQTTAGSFAPNPSGWQELQGQGGPLPNTAIEKVDAQLAGVLNATYFGGHYLQISVMTIDSAGNVYAGGYTAPQGLPTRTPLQAGFAATAGFLSELSGDLSTLLFSSYFGDTQNFAVQGVGIDPKGTVRIGGAAAMNIWVNSLALAPPPPLRIDAVVSAASLLDGPISAGETIVVQGAGLGSSAQLFINGAAVPAISVTAITITAVVPQNIPIGAAEFQVQSSGASSNQVQIPVGVTSPGIFSQNSSGYGQGYILNKDGTLNTPSNPAAPGDPITIYATGVGPVSFTDGYAVTQFPVNVFIDGFYANGVAARMGPVSGFSGSVYQITVYVPNPASLTANNPDLKNFEFPPLAAVTMQIDGVTSQNGIAISIGQ